LEITSKVDAAERRGESVRRRELIKEVGRCISGAVSARSDGETRLGS
jgi:hypothetical protein